MERRSAGRGVCFVRPSPSYSGLARRRRRRRRAHPVGEFALYASRRRLRAWPGGGSGGARSWTGSLLCTLLGADFGPGPEGAAEGCAAGQEFGLYATRRRLRAWHGGGGGGERSQLGSLLCLPCAAVARRQRLREAQLDGEFAFYAPRRHLRAWPRGGGGGELSWTGNLYSTPRAADFGSGPEVTVERRAAGRGVCFVRPSPPSSGLARREQRRGAQLKGNSLCTPRVVVFGPGPEAAAEGCASSWGVCFVRLWPPTSGLARRRRRRGAQLDGEFALYASRRRLRAWPGGGGGGARN